MRNWLVSAVMIDYDMPAGAEYEWHRLDSEQADYEAWFEMYAEDYWPEFLDKVVDAEDFPDLFAKWGVSNAPDRYAKYINGDLTVEEFKKLEDEWKASLDFDPYFDGFDDYVADIYADWEE